MSNVLGWETAMQKTIIRRLSKKEIKEKINELSRTFSKIILETWGDPGDTVKVFLNTADILYIATVNGQIAGFASGEYFDKNTLYLHATVVHKDFSGLGLYKILNNKVINKYALIHPKNLLMGFYCVFRTSNPSLYERVYKIFPLYPDFQNNRKPNSFELETFKKICSHANPNDIDIEKFVEKNAYTNSTGLIRNPDDIPFAYNTKINEFFEKRLNLSKMEGNGLICIGRINLFLIVKYVFKNLLS